MLFASNKHENADHLPGWATFPLLDRQVLKIHHSEVFMDHYLVLLLEEPDADPSKPAGVLFGRGSRSTDVPTTLLVFDLRDNRIQEVKLDKSLFCYLYESTFTKYKDNQIIKFGGCSKKMVRITIESFEPLTVTCEEIKVEGDQPKAFQHAAQIYNDTLYVVDGTEVRSLRPFGQQEEKNEDPKRDLWSFDLKTLSWKACQSTGPKPVLNYQPFSFVIEDNLYIYDRKAIFTLNLNSMEWTRTEQKETYPKDGHANTPEMGKTIYKDHLLFLKNPDGNISSQKRALRCWNINTNSWLTFDVQLPNLYDHDLAEGSAVYKNLLLTPKLEMIGGSSERKTPFVAILNLDNIDLPTPESPEQKRLRSLFMSEEESDVKFKVQDQIIPTHKQVLIEKSKYFNNLFKSGMAESQQSIIEITDCDPLLFQEYLRFLYYGEVKKDEDLAIKLFLFADKYVQNDLREACVHFLKSNVSSNNVYKILDFSRQENLPPLKEWCFNLLRNKIDIKNISGLIEYLNKQNNPEFAQENLELRNKALHVVLNNYLEISKDEKISSTFYEDFLIKNIAFDTVLDLGKFIYGHNLKTNRPNSTALNLQNLREQEKEKLEPLTANFRPVLLEFIQKNLKTLNEKKIAGDLPNALFIDLLLYGPQTPNSHQKDLHLEAQTSQ